MWSLLYINIRKLQCVVRDLTILINNYNWLLSDIFLLRVFCLNLAPDLPETTSFLSKTNFFDLLNYYCCLFKCFTLFRMGEAKRLHPLTSFFIVTCTSVRTSPKKFQTFSLNLLVTLVKFSMLCLVSVKTYWPWTKSTPQKNWFF